MSQESQDLDPVVLLSALAAATRRIQLVAGVLVLPLHNPVLLANQAASLDVVSDGRFVLGAGVGWDADEFAALGVPFAERGARADESLRVLKALWRHEYVDFDGRFTALRHAGVTVDPATAGGPPVWIGGHSDAGLLRALRYGHAWHGTGLDAAGLAGIRRRIESLSHAARRDPATLALTAVCFLVPPGFAATEAPPGSPLGGGRPTLARVADELNQLQAGGLSTCSLWMPIRPAAMPDALAWIAEDLVPQLDPAPVVTAP